MEPVTSLPSSIKCKKVRFMIAGGEENEQFLFCAMPRTHSYSTSEGRVHMLYYGNNAQRRKMLVSKVTCAAASQRRWEDAPQPNSSCPSSCLIVLPIILLGKIVSSSVSSAVTLSYCTCLKNQFSNQCNEGKIAVVPGEKGSSKFKSALICSNRDDYVCEIRTFFAHVKGVKLRAFADTPQVLNH